MWDWPITYFALGFCAGLIAFFDIAGTADQIAWVFCAIFAVLFVLSLLHRYSSA